MIADETQVRLTAIENKLQKIYEVRLTGQAKDILGEALTAIINDPHQSWPQSVKVELSDFESDMANAAPAALAALAISFKIKTITSFDLLHGMTGFIERICPFDKPQPAYR